jgi:hypothetical protein
MKLAKVIRSQFIPPGTLIIGQMPDEDEKLLILPPETSDEVLVQAEEMVRVHNNFERMIDYFNSITSKRKVDGTTRKN